MVLLDAVLLRLTALWYAPVLEPPADGAARAYRLVAGLAQWPLVAGAFVLPLALPLVAAWPRRRLVAALAVIAGTLGTLVLCIDAVVFAEYRMHLGGYALGLLFGGAGGQIFNFSPVVKLIAAAIVLVAAALQLGAWRLGWRLSGEVRARKPLRVALASWTMALVVVNGWHAVADAAQDVRITEETGVLPFFAPLRAKRLLYGSGLMERREPALSAKTGVRALDYPAEPLRCDGSGRAAPPNVLLVLVDAWRPEELNAQTTPRLFELSRGGTVFERHVSGGSATRFGVFSLFYALPGSYWNAALRTRQPPVMIEELQRQGYDFAVLASAPLIRPEFDATVFATVRGIRTRTPGDSASERDRRISDDMVAFLRGRGGSKRPFFGFLFYDGAHAYDVPKDAEQPFQPSWDQVNYLALREGFDKTPYYNRYRNALHAVDAQAGRVIDALEETGQLESTLIVVTSDHGEEFDDTGKGYWGHNGNFSPWQVHVPLFLRGPGWGPATVAGMTSHYDVAPTILAGVLGCANDPSTYGIGVPLLQAAATRTAVPLFDFTKMGILERGRLTMLSPYGSFTVMTERLDPLDEEPSDALVAAVRHDMLRFSRARPTRAAR